MPYDLQDSLFPRQLNGIPDTFTPFQNRAERNYLIDAPFPVPLKLLLPEHFEIPLTDKCSLSYMPALERIWATYTPQQIEEVNAVDLCGIMEFKGGETAALQCVKDIIWVEDLLRDYFDTHNGMTDADDSTWFAPWLAHGFISPQYVAKECRKYFL
jgi:deoxyribodipyrimidine photo-lyase